MRLLRIVLTLLAVPVLAADPVPVEEPAEAPPKIYTCKDADGNTVYQDDPCVDKPRPVAKPPAAPKPGAAAKAPAVKKPAAGTKPAAGSKPAAASSSPVVTKPPASMKRRTGALPSLKIPFEPGRSIDPRWATPESTLRTFIGAVNAGDRALAVSCLTSFALSDLGPEPDDLPLDDLRETVGSFTGYVAEGDLGPFWSIRALREGARPKWIFFERTGAGEWKIQGI